MHSNEYPAQPKIDIYCQSVPVCIAVLFYGNSTLLCLTSRNPLYFQDYIEFIFMCIVLLTFLWELGRESCVHSFSNPKPETVLSPLILYLSLTLAVFSALPSSKHFLSLLTLLQDFFPSGSDQATLCFQTCGASLSPKKQSPILYQVI